MDPRIIEYKDGRVSITAEAFVIKELNDIINKWGEEGAEPYLAFVHLRTHPESPYTNLPEEEINDQITYDITQSIGLFDNEEELLQPAIDRLNKIWDTPDKRYYEALKIAMDKTTKALIQEEVTIGGKDATFDSIQRAMKDAGNFLKSFKQVEKIVDEDAKAKMKGKSTLGDY